LLKARKIFMGHPPGGFGSCNRYRRIQIFLLESKPFFGRNGFFEPGCE